MKKTIQHDAVLSNLSITIRYAVRCGLIVLMFCLFMQTAHAKQQGQWLSPHLKNHPLVGTVWDNKGRKIKHGQFVAAVEKATFLLLGEMHANPDHHRLQSDMLQLLIEAGRRPVVVFEMLTPDMQAKLQVYRESGQTDLDKLGNLLRWEKRGWPKWQIYKPIFATALAADLSITAGGIERQQLYKIGQEAAYKNFIQDLGIQFVLEDNAQAALERMIKHAHCNMLPESAIGMMARIQRARDVRLSKSLLNANLRDGAVLIAGSGHVRRDWAVAQVLKQNSSAETILAIRFAEVDTNKLSVADYTAREDKLTEPFDYTYFTPRSNFIDHCARMREHMKKSHGSKG